MRLVHAATFAAIAMSLTACGTLGYEDTNAAVDERTGDPGRDRAHAAFSSAGSRPVKKAQNAG